MSKEELNASGWADLRGKVTCSAAHTGNGLMSRRQATTQKTWLSYTVVPTVSPCHKFKEGRKGK